MIDQNVVREALRRLAEEESSLGREARSVLLQVANGRAEIADADDAAQIIRASLPYTTQEAFIVVSVDAKNRVLASTVVHIGTLTCSIIGQREVFRRALLDGACSIIVGHNHPSGEVQPSPEDIEATKKLMQMGELLEIPVLDHIIVAGPTSPDYTSIRKSHSHLL